MFLLRFLVGSCFGVAAHLGIFIRGEWHLQGPQIVTTHAWMAIMILLAESFLGDSTSMTAILVGASLTVWGYLIGMFTSMTIYRLFFHRLRNFPGPRIAAVSKLWHAWQLSDSRNHLFLDDMHEKYGEFVRIGPRELACCHPDAHQILEGFGTPCRKTDFYDLLLPEYSLVFTRSKEVHDQRQKVWTSALNTNAISLYKPRIRRQVQTLVNSFYASAETQQPVLVNDLAYWFTFDSMGEFAFNKDFGMMRHSQWHSSVRTFRNALSLIGPLGPAIWVVKLGLAFLPGTWKMKDWLDMMRFCEGRLNERMKIQPEEKDIATYFIAEADKLGHTETMRRWLKGDSAAVIVAGSETTASTLTFLLYILATHPHHLDTLHAELTSPPTDPFDPPALARLPHLNACINETMRLFPAVLTTPTRDTPAEGITIGDTFVPGGIKVQASRWRIAKLESAFERANDFVPERWYSRPEMIRNKMAFAPFGKGYTACVGQELARTQLRMVLANVVLRMRFRFLDGDRGEAVIRDLRDQITAQPGELRVMFEPREKAEK